MRGQAFMTMDVLLLRIPQCLWTWAFLIMGTVWQEIAAAATNAVIPMWFKVAMNVVALLVTAAEVAITIVAAHLLSTHHEVALILYHVGDGILALSVLVLAAAGARAAWTVIFLLHEHHTSLSAAASTGLSRAPGPCAVLCTPMTHDEEAAVWATDEEDAEDAAVTTSAAFAAVYEALRQATLWLLAAVLVAVALITDVAVDTGMGLSTASTPSQYLWFLGIFLSCEAVGSLLLAIFTWPRAQGSDNAAGSLSTY